MKGRTPGTPQRRKDRPAAAAGERIGAIAHDLNNLFAPILMAVSLLEARATEAGSARAVAIIGEYARRGAGLVERLEAIAREAETGPARRGRAQGRRPR